jgi:hypothetical protein
MCTVLLPPGVNPIAVDKYIISNHSEQVLPLKTQSMNVVTRNNGPFLERILGITQIICVQSTEISALCLTLPTITTGL